MIQSISKPVMLLIALLFSFNSFAQLSNATTITVKINGNCAMCQSTIEKAGTRKHEARINWDKASKTATITYDSKKTNPGEILKRIALAGYDNEQFLAPDAVYAQLPECCLYDRTLKPISKVPQKAMNDEQTHKHHGTSVLKDAGKETSQLKVVFDHYFSLKDALVQSEAPAATVHASALLTSLKAVDMVRLSTAEHTVWMQVMKNLKDEAERISLTKDIAQQRASFALLSENIYALSKVSKLAIPVYYQHCPMYAQGKGGNWLSKENTVKNPYYGAQMLTCGQTVETIK